MRVPIIPTQLRIDSTQFRTLFQPEFQATTDFEKSSVAMEKALEKAMGKLEEAQHILTVPELEIEKVRGRGDAFLNSGKGNCCIWAVNKVEIYFTKIGFVDSK